MPLHAPMNAPRRFARDAGAQDRQRQRRDDRSADALSRTCGDEHSGRGRKGGGGGRDREDGEADREHPAPSEAIAERSAGEQEDRDLHGVVRRRRPCALGGVHGRYGAARRRDHHPADADHPERGPAEKRRRGALGAWGGIGGLAVASGRWSAERSDGLSWHWIFWLNVPIGIVLSRWRSAAWTSRGPAAARPPGSRSQRRSHRHRVGSRPRHGQGWTSPRSSRPRGRRHRARALRRLGAPRRGADAADALLPQSRVRARERHVAADVLRDVRVDLPAVAVLPDRAGLLARSGPACGSCRGRSCRCSSRRSPALSPTGSAARG